jgi:hypothetical protein
MPYTNLAARQQLIDSLYAATAELADAIAALGAAHEQLDDQQADRLEDELFRPLQRAYSRARKTQEGFAARYSLPTHDAEPPITGAPATGVKGFIEAAVAAVIRADNELAAIQDSLMPIEVGDPELRAGLTEVRQLVNGLSHRARAFLRTFGR